jgi:hypothetical protein
MSVTARQDPRLEVYYHTLISVCQPNKFQSNLTVDSRQETQDSRLIITGAWSEGFTPFLSSRSISTCLQRSINGLLIRM